ncbi:Peptidase inhibitor I78 family protein [Roseovarius litorisediminis]|uniref:Peptidase inhibitor I78 family protein n=1 Tax=Roseovarius litorisediminis TaxID=1312363 RepID=A0A1Y5SS40_9RHOB|nr:I78 family peptidase inhibitor [Roseovarius litorisediminis]SLN45689.1 Peptidase inhibitor I78 family protein [Roseovarius litorisediminis]
MGLVMVFTALTACAPGANDGFDITSPESPCGAKRLQHLIGVRPDDFVFETLGVPFRILPPGSAMTMDHNPKRLNVSVDDANRISRLWCG